MECLTQDGQYAMSRALTAAEWQKFLLRQVVGANFRRNLACTTEVAGPGTQEEGVPLGPGEDKRRAVRIP